jgi:hypothetical protein
MLEVGLLFCFPDSENVRRIRPLCTLQLTKLFWQELELFYGQTDFPLNLVRSQRMHGVPASHMTSLSLNGRKQSILTIRTSTYHTIIEVADTSPNRANSIQIARP